MSTTKSKQRSPRKQIPDRIKLLVALRRFGLSISDVQFDHYPALALRPHNDLTGDTIPPANDPEYINMLLVEEHRIKTYGPGGEKRITTAGSDSHAIAKVRRLAPAKSDFDRRVLAKSTDGDRPSETQPKRKIPSRPFPKRKKT